MLCTGWYSKYSPCWIPFGVNGRKLHLIAMSTYTRLRHAWGRKGVTNKGAYTIPFELLTKVPGTKLESPTRSS